MPPRAVVTISSNVRRVWRTPPRAVANGHLVAPISCHIVVTVRAATTDCVVVAVVIVVFVAAVVVDTAVVAGLVVVVVAVVVVAVVVVVALVVVIVFVCDVGMVGVAAVVGIVCVRSPFQEQSSVAAASWNAPPCREHMWKGGLWSAMQRHFRFISFGCNIRTEPFGGISTTSLCTFAGEDSAKSKGHIG